MPQRAAIISYDASGVPTLLADPRTPASEQHIQFRAIKTGDSPTPDDSACIEFVTWHSGEVERWLPTAETETKTTKKTKK